jgi:hypothetical protein
VMAHPVELEKDGRMTADAASETIYRLVLP